MPLAKAVERKEGLKKPAPPTLFGVTQLKFQEKQTYDLIKHAKKVAGSKISVRAISNKPKSIVEFGLLLPEGRGARKMEIACQVAWDKIA